jgi:hypothetical protein
VVDQTAGGAVPHHNLSSISRNSYSSVVIPNTAGWQNLVGIRWDVYLQTGNVLQNSMDFALDNIVLVQDGDGSYMCAPA